MPPRFLLLFAAALGLAAFAFGSDLVDRTSPEALEAFFRDHGALGPFVYVLLFSLLQPFGVFGFLFIAAGSLVWDVWTLFFVSWLGAIGAGIVGFGFARSFGRGFAERHLPAAARRYDDRLARNAFTGVVVVRLVAGLWQPAHFLLGLSKVGFAPFVLGTAIGFAPQIAVLSYTGSEAVEWLSSRPSGPSRWLLPLAAAAAVAFLLVRRRRAAAQIAGAGELPATRRSEP